jgi:membrane protease YdiL (CAAX protease family)
MQPIIGILILVIAITVYGYLVQRHFYKRHYTISNLIFAILAVSFAAFSGATRISLGLNLRKSSILAAAITIIVTVLIVSFVIKYTSLKMQIKDYKELVIRIPFGTALSEELIFRSALMGLFLQNYSRLSAVLFSSLIFGFWHLLPGEESIWAQQNIKYKNAGPNVSKLYSSGLTVLVTSLGGIIFGWLRIVNGGILLPWAAHTSINAASWTINKAGLQENFVRSLRLKGKSQKR